MTSGPRHPLGPVPWAKIFYAFKHNKNGRNERLFDTILFKLMKKWEKIVFLWIQHYFCIIFFLSEKWYWINSLYRHTKLPWSFFDRFGQKRRSLNLLGNCLLYITAILTLLFNMNCRLILKSASFYRQVSVINPKMVYMGLADSTDGTRHSFGLQSPI